MMKMLSDNTKSSLTDNLRGLPILSYHWFFDIDNSLIILNPIPAGPFAQRIPAGGGSYGPAIISSYIHRTGLIHSSNESSKCADLGHVTYLHNIHLHPRISASAYVHK